jgi:hypothetical protein
MTRPQITFELKSKKFASSQNTYVTGSHHSTESQI